MARPTVTTVAVQPVDLRRGGAEPIHSQIERALRSNIVSGRWPPGSKLPPEPDLAARLGVNRGTLRRAMLALATAGFVTSTRGRGTFVTDTVRPSIAQRFRSLSEDFADQSIRYRVDVLAARTVPLDPKRSTLFSAATDEAGFELLRVFRGDDGPLAFVVNTVRLALCPDIGDVDFTRNSLFRTLADRYGIAIARGRRTFRAAAAGSDVASALELADASPVLWVDQVSYTESGEAVECSDVWLNSDRVELTSILQRDTAPADAS